MEEQGNMIPPKVPNYLVTDLKDTEEDEVLGKQFKRMIIKNKIIKMNSKRIQINS